MDVLEWSMPFLMDKVMSMLTHITQKAGMGNKEMVVNEDMKSLLEQQKE